MNKDVKGFGMPWEEQYGFAQAIKVDDTIYVSGQLSHDDKGNVVGAAMALILSFVRKWREWYRVLRYRKGFGLFASVRYGLWLARS
jgi:hypothetical protein